MFIWDFLASVVLDQIVDWIYTSIVGFLGDFFALMGQMGAELFDLPWVEAVTMFFGNFAWALYITGIVMAGFECAIEAQNGRGDIKATGLNILKGFFAVNLFNILPIRLYQFSISLQASFTSDLAGINISNGIGTTAAEILQNITSSMNSANPLVMLFAVIMMGYAVIKVFFANLKGKPSPCREPQATQPAHTSTSNLLWTERREIPAHIYHNRKEKICEHTTKS